MASRSGGRAGLSNLFAGCALPSRPTAWKGFEQMRNSRSIVGLAALLLGLGLTGVSMGPAYAQRGNPCLGDGVSTQAEIDRRCAAAHGRVPAPYQGGRYERPRDYEPRYERRGGYERRDRYFDDYAPRRRDWRYDDDD